MYGDWWSQYQALPSAIRRAIRRGVWAGQAETDPALMQITLAYAEWVSTPRAFWFRLVAWLPISLIPAIGFIVIGRDTVTVVLALTYAFGMYVAKVGLETRRTPKARESANYARSTLYRWAGDGRGWRMP